MDCFARRTASFPESVHSERIPTFTSIFVTLSQVLKSSSTTKAFKPSSSLIFIEWWLTDCMRNGRRTMNSVPFPCFVWIWIVPPIISTIFFVIAIPRTVPWILLTVDVRSRSNESNILFKNSSLMPIPLSLTRISYSPLSFPGLASWASRTETVPPDGVNLMALDKRFNKTWFSLVLSQYTSSSTTSMTSIYNSSCFAWICPLMIVFTSWRTSARFTSVSSRWIFPLSIRLISRISLINESRWLLDASILPR